ncbi:hypothetical protein DACRYDRAFT_13475 [Dacryopinax primogenitus]|uniref:Uncharacterized protein n=1 Tax=Dacryopinax primogenitus (strain DJM 731) TaxID=1858805 RepID=M5G9K5_DACPD|nr:uncharacterized protein DACRYDRAFT_13475 [Dacryopinax primogenitus]EJU05479.1 hypothetical protein DACRYDRAFT_13475 [Dacryopinax primogenitus]
MVGIFSKKFDPEFHIWMLTQVCFHGFPARVFKSTEKCRGKKYGKCQCFSHPLYNCKYWQWCDDFEVRIGDFKVLVRPGRLVFPHGIEALPPAELLEVLTFSFGTRQALGTTNVQESSRNAESKGKGLASCLLTSRALLLPVVSEMGEEDVAGGTHCCHQSTWMSGRKWTEDDMGEDDCGSTIIYAGKENVLVEHHTQENTANGWLYTS